MGTKHSVYKRLGNYIREVDIRNRDLAITRLVGLTIDKAFIPSVANIVGTDLSNYKVIRNEQFACSLMQVSRDGKIPVAMFEDQEAIMSPAYPMFEISDTSILLPKYLMMWFSRREFDREASFYAVGGVRGSLAWEDFCDLRLPIPPIECQRELVAEYETLSRRIRLNEQFISRLESLAQALYRRTFVDSIDKENLPASWRMGTIGEFCKKMTSGGTPSRTHPEYWNKREYRWLKTGEVQNNVILEVEEYISREGLENSSAKLIPAGTVVMAMYGATAALVGYLCCETTTNQACCNMICYSKEEAAYLYFHLRFYQEDIKRMANGGAQENLSQELIASLPLLIPKDKNAFKPFVIILDQMILAHREQNLLARMRKLRLTNLDSIRVTR